MVCRDFILPEPASYVFFYAVFNLRKLLYIIPQEENRRCFVSVMPVYARLGLTLTLYRNPLCVRAPTDSQRKTAPHNGGTVLLRLVIKRSQWDKQGSDLA